MVDYTGTFPQLTEEFGRDSPKETLSICASSTGILRIGSPAVPCQSDTAVSAGQPIAQTLSAQFTPVLSSPTSS